MAEGEEHAKTDEDDGDGRQEERETPVGFDVHGGHHCSGDVADGSAGIPQTEEKAASVFGEPRAENGGDGRPAASVENAGQRHEEDEPPKMMDAGEVCEAQAGAGHAGQDHGDGEAMVES